MTEAEEFFLQEYANNVNMMVAYRKVPVSNGIDINDRNPTQNFKSCLE